MDKLYLLNTCISCVTLNIPVKMAYCLTSTWHVRKNLILQSWNAILFSNEGQTKKKDIYNTSHKIFTIYSLVLELTFKCITVHVHTSFTTRDGHFSRPLQADTIQFQYTHIYLLTTLVHALPNRKTTLVNIYGYLYLW